ncbi:MAG TPA: DUF6516 family protein [Blastocatellia bacterium]|nr:DUF6516 family protein [Blastocatellia bacterium]
MRDMRQYFDLIAKLIEISPAVSAELDLDQLDHKRGTVEGTLYFADSSRLEFSERIVIERARPVKRGYRYQYVRNQKPVFRYDNAPHHPQLPGYPHHKHVGRKAIPASEPTLKQIVQEVAEMLPASSGPAEGAPPRRRRPQSQK